jgi:predicted dienelactone hydrolase
MSFLDILLIGAILGSAAAWIAAAERFRPLLRIALALLVILAAVQITTEGAYWQFATGYALVLALAVLGMTQLKGLAQLAARIGVGALMLLAIAPWLLFFPVPTLTPPSGPYAVGTQVFRWIDASRPEEATADPADKRNVIAQAWYPAAPGAVGPHSTYMDGLEALPPKVSLFPGFILRSYGRIDTHGILNAPISPARPQWPVVLFSPGYGAIRAAYTSLALDLASRGYVVIALDHPYEAAVTQLADGRIVYDANLFAGHDDTEAHQWEFMAQQQVVRASDMSFALDQLARPDATGPVLAGHLDLAHAAAIGHSFGGASAIVAMDRDPRILAAANIDGTLYGGLSGEARPRPFLLIESDRAETDHSDIYLAGARLAFQHFGAGPRFELKRASHFSFTDAPLFLAPPGRWASTFVIGGERDVTETHRATVDILDAFLKGPLTGTPADIDAAAAAHPEIARGEVN